MPLLDLDEVETKINAHWEYLKGVLTHRGIDDTHLKEIEYHYKTSGLHFYGHAWEDCQKETL